MYGQDMLDMQIPNVDRQIANTTTNVTNLKGSYKRHLHDGYAICLWVEATRVG